MAEKYKMGKFHTLTSWEEVSRPGRRCMLSMQGLSKVVSFITTKYHGGEGIHMKDVAKKLQKVS